MQNVGQGTPSGGKPDIGVGTVNAAAGPSTAPGAIAPPPDQHSSSNESSPAKSETDTFSEIQPRFMSESSESDEEDVSEVSRSVRQSLGPVPPLFPGPSSRLPTSSRILSPPLFGVPVSPPINCGGAAPVPRLPTSIYVGPAPSSPPPRSYPPLPPIALSGHYCVPL
ncbi:hypothetical protein AAG570_002212 [Ranatra chinensis]|uniref:Uncharacterized protein n=1 Tax=Ranatra chinensis TaxID=642074 RepID=A0ABD0Y8X5_9HEMI